MKPVVIVDYVRSPFTPANRGALSSMRADDLAAQVIRGLIDRTGIDPVEIEDLIVGCAFPEAEQGLNVARLIGVLAGLPMNVGGVTVNRFCGSSMQAIHMAAGAIQMNAGEAFICAGVESMTRVPIMGFNPMPNPALFERFPQAYVSMGETAENVAAKYEISRSDQDTFAEQSHQKATAAQVAVQFADEIVPIVTTTGTVDQDGCIRPETTLEKLAALNPAFDENGTVTAGTSSPLTDGASAVLVCTQEYADRMGLEALAVIKGIAIHGCQPELMGLGPIGASKKALSRAGIGVEDLDIIELNEAFAAQALANIRELGLNGEKINLDGGAIAIGHPLGATGARITGKAAQLLKRQQASYGLATQCIGGGQGIATVLEAVR
ncbi:MAG: thiolase family protein [Anderseniella sp.]